MNKTKKSVNHDTATPSTQTTMVTTCGKAVDNHTLSVVRADIARLSADYSQLAATRAVDYLTSAQGADLMLLDAWEGFGRRDLHRVPSVSLSATARRTMTPLGLACLIRYARGWLDEAEAQQLVRDQQARSICRPPDGESRRRQAGQSRTARRPATAKRTK